MFAIFKALIWQICCMFCDCCDGGDCTDGVCDTSALREAVEELRTGTPDASATKTMAVTLDWTQIQPTIDAILAAVRQIMLLFGIKPKVG